MIKKILNQGKALRTLRKTSALIGMALAGVSQAQAEACRDGEDGWSVLFIACHLRDYEAAWRERVELALAEDAPTFVSFDQIALIEQNAYASQRLADVLADLSARRAALIDRLQALDDAQWLRAGQHPEQGPGTVLDLAINAGLHDLDHLEQLARCLAPLRA